MWGAGARGCPEGQRGAISGPWREAARRLAARTRGSSAGRSIRVMVRGMSYSSAAEELREHVRIQVQIGFCDSDAIVEEAAYMFEVEEEVVGPIVDEMLAALEAEEGWLA